MGKRRKKTRMIAASASAGHRGRVRSSATRFGLVALLLVMALTVLACGGEQETGLTTGQTTSLAPTTSQTTSTTEPQSPSEPDPTVPTTPPGGGTVDLPAPVAQTRDAILDAAGAFDYEALEGLLDPATFSYSFGESGDPIGYWRKLEDEGQVPILGDFLRVVLSMQAGTQDGVYVWPAAFAKEPSDWTADDVADMRMLYTDEEISSYKGAGGYVGYRVGIRGDGTWIYFVAGD